uniref:Uncharacterized protein n=1 Tax=Moniliophthora roreri TaxID=221103 RepID=A0A0W0GDZ3_MONRR
MYLSDTPHFKAEGLELGRGLGQRVFGHSRGYGGVLEIW